MTLNAKSIKTQKQICYKKKFSKLKTETTKNLKVHLVQESHVLRFVIRNTLVNISDIVLLLVEVALTLLQSLFQIFQVASTKMQRHYSYSTISNLQSNSPAIWSKASYLAAYLSCFEKNLARGCRSN